MFSPKLVTELWFRLNILNATEVKQIEFIICFGPMSAFITITEAEGICTACRAVQTRCRNVYVLDEFHELNIS